MARECHGAVTPHVIGGVYVNVLGLDQKDRVGTTYGAKYGRLAELQKKWDRENLFRMNHNVPPAR